MLPNGSPLPASHCSRSTFISRTERHRCPSSCFLGPPPVVLGPGAPVNCGPGDLGPTCTGSSAQTCGLLSSCFSAFLQDRGEEESTCAVLAGSGGGGGDAGQPLRWVSPHPHPGGCLRWGRTRQICGAGWRGAWGGVHPSSATPGLGGHPGTPRLPFYPKARS